MATPPIKHMAMYWPQVIFSGNARCACCALASYWIFSCCVFSHFLPFVKSSIHWLARSTSRRKYFSSVLTTPQIIAPFKHADTITTIKVSLKVMPPCLPARRRSNDLTKRGVHRPDGAGLECSALLFAIASVLDSQSRQYENYLNPNSILQY